MENIPPFKHQEVRQQSKKPVSLKSLSWHTRGYTDSKVVNDGEDLDRDAHRQSPLVQ